MWLEIIIGIMTIIQTFEFIYLIQSSRRTNELIEDPAPILIGLIKRVQEDKEFAAAFGGLIVWAGQCAVQGVKDKVATDMKPPKIKNLSDVLGYLVQMPQIQSAIQNKVSGALGDKAEAVVEQML